MPSDGNATAADTHRPAGHGQRPRSRLRGQSARTRRRRRCAGMLDRLSGAGHRRAPAGGRCRVRPNGARRHRGDGALPQLAGRRSPGIRGGRSRPRRGRRGNPRRLLLPDSGPQSLGLRRPARPVAAPAPGRPRGNRVRPDRRCAGAPSGRTGRSDCGGARERAVPGAVRSDRPAVVSERDPGAHRRGIRRERPPRAHAPAGVAAPARVAGPRPTGRASCVSWTTSACCLPG